MDLNGLPGYQVVRSTQLFQNYPNPFRGVTYIPVDVVHPNTRVTIRIIDVAGKQVATIADEEMASGSYEIRWDASEIAEGILYCILKSDGVIMTRKMVVMH
jgi:hypothetical protein